MKARCELVWRILPESKRWAESFYHLGHYFQDFHQVLAELKLTSKEKRDWSGRMRTRSPLFSSAVTHKPYPLALLEEYIEITRKVCERAKLRRSLERTPASRSNDGLEIAMSNRCNAVGIGILE
jgi:hypothetical protein